MKLLVDREIRALAIEQGMISPFIPQMVRSVKSASQSYPEDIPVISYGLGSCGYDFRLGSKFFSIPGDSIIDVKQGQVVKTIPTLEDHGPLIQEKHTSVRQSPFAMKPGEYLLAETMERWVLPEDVFSLVIGKSTYARWGLILNVTPMEPGWAGILTLELYNASPAHLTIYPGEGIGQAIFYQGDAPEVNYLSRKGKYQNQTGLTFGHA